LGTLHLTGMAEGTPQEKDPRRTVGAARRTPAPQFNWGEPLEYQGQMKPTSSAFREGRRVRAETKVHRSQTSFMTSRDTELSQIRGGILCGAMKLASEKRRPAEQFVWFASNTGLDAQLRDRADLTQRGAECGEVQAALTKPRRLSSVSEGQPISRVREPRARHLAARSSTAVWNLQAGYDHGQAPDNGVPFHPCR
jgi:hypothetical protein